MTTSASYPDGSSWSITRQEGPRINIWVKGTLSPKRARELSEAIEWEVQRAEEIMFVLNLEESQP